MTKSKVIVAMMAVMILGSTGNAYADSLEEAALEIQKNSQGKLIGLDGQESLGFVMVNLADGQMIEIIRAPLMKVANTVCDIATVKPAGATGRFICCIAK